MGLPRQDGYMSGARLLIDNSIEYIETALRVDDLDGGHVQVKTGKGINI